MVYVSEVLDIMRTCVVIPTYNESKAITGLVKRITEQGLDVLVIDDGSQDNTSQLAAETGALVLRNEENLGKGLSLIKGFQYAIDKKFDAVITMDGDGQHCPEDIPFFLRLAKYSDSGMFIGNRMSSIKDMPGIRVLTNKFMSCIISRIIGQRVPDTQCGFRLIKAEVLRKLDLRCAKFEIESESIIKTARSGFRIESVPIKTIYNNEKSRINPLIDTFRFLRFIIRELSLSGGPDKQ